MPYLVPFGQYDPIGQGVGLDTPCEQKVSFWMVESQK